MRVTLANNEIRKPRVSESLGEGEGIDAKRPRRTTGDDDPVTVSLQTSGISPPQLPKRDHLFLRVRLTLIARHPGRLHYSSVVRSRRVADVTHK
jgi:hypothetical protein